MKSHRGGQSLIELIIGFAIGALLVVSAIMAITLTLRSRTTNTASQTAVFLGQELLESVRSFSKGNWAAMYLLERSPFQYALLPAGSTFATGTGAEIVVIDGATFTRTFVLKDVLRNGVPDPNVLEITVFITQGGGAALATTSLATYVAGPSAGGSDAFVQTDWSGGVSGEQILSAPGITFASSTLIDYASLPGSIKVLGY